jgi:hypothetical protein
MITNDGIELISKFLAGQASSYASHIAIGSGQRPLLNGRSATVIQAATLGTVTLTSGVYTATVTVTTGYASYIEVGDIIQSQYTTVVPPQTGTLGVGPVTVTSITGPKTFEVSSTAAMTAGTLGTISVTTNITSKTLSSKTKLDFEMARFPIISRSYVVDKQVAKCSLIAITGEHEIAVTTVGNHSFGNGDTVYITDVDVTTGTPLFDPQVNGLYVVTSFTSTGFNATMYDPTSGSWDNSLFTFTADGYSYNNFEFNATVYVKQLSLTAEVLDINQYDITELGLYSLGSNQYNTTSNSRILLKFTQDENWQYSTYDSLTTNFSYSDVSLVSPMVETFASNPFFVDANDSYWTDASVALRQEKPRMLGDALVLPGDLSNWSSGTSFDAASEFIEMSNPGINLSKNSSSDIISLAFSIANAEAAPTAVPTGYYIMLEFTYGNGTDYARLLFTDADAGGVSLPANRYVVLSKTIGDIVTTSGFNWGNVTSLKVYSSIEVSGGTPTNDYAIVLDGLRFENVSTDNPLYALTAYTIVNNDTATKITKKANSKDLINFRLDLAIGR